MSRNKPSVAKGAFNITSIVAATAIQVLAALALDGWLAIGLWVVAGRNVIVLILTMLGLLQMAVEQRKAELTNTNA